MPDLKPQHISLEPRTERALLDAVADIHPSQKAFFDTIAKQQGRLENIRQVGNRWFFAMSLRDSKGRRYFVCTLDHGMVWIQGIFNRFDRQKVLTAVDEDASIELRRVNA